MCFVTVSLDSQRSILIQLALTVGLLCLLFVATIIGENWSDFLPLSNWRKMGSVTGIM